MKSRMNMMITATGSLMILAVLTSSANANLLVDPGFEVNPLTSYVNVLNNFPGYQGIWGVESATISGVDGGVTPAQGTKMLRMTDDGLTATQAFQATDVTSYAALIDSGGAIVNLGALLNADANVPAASGGVTVLFFSASNWGSQIGSPLIGNITLDNLPGTWELASVSGAIPVSTRWLITQVAYSNVSLQNHPGYVDATRLTVTPEPVSIVLLGLGGLLLFVRKHSTVA